MDGVRTEVLPLNQQAITAYFAYNWVPVHTLIAPLLSLRPELDDLEKFKFTPYLKAEEARLENNLRAVDYVIDGTDTLTLITGMGRIEKVSTWRYQDPLLNNLLQTVFPLLYLLMKRHFEITRIMRTKVLDSRELSDARKSMYHVRSAINYRADDLTSKSISLSLVFFMVSDQSV